MQGPARAYSLWTFFFWHFFQKDCKKKTAVFKKDLVLILQRFVNAFEKHAPTIQNHSTTIRNKKEAGKKNGGGAERLILIANANSNL